MAPRRRSRERRAITTDSSRSAPRATVAHPPSPQRPRPHWRWRTFPVFAAFSLGLLVAFIANEGSVNPVAFVLQIAALLGVGYSLAHLVVTNIIGAGRARRRDRDDDTEDVVVHPDE